MKLGIFFGGQSTERQISIRTCRNIFKILKLEKNMDVDLFELDSQGNIWSIDSNFFNDTTSIEKYRNEIKISDFDVDIYFSLIHGNLGEDGGLQGLFRSLNKPFIGCSTLSSAICMDKDISKRILSFEGINVADWLVIKSPNDYSYKEVSDILKTPFYVKPANLGSSVGISRVTSNDEYLKALKNAFKYDHKIILEQEIKGIEVECGVIGNDNLIVSEVGSIETEENDFYDYSKKYIDEHGAVLNIPATISSSLRDKVRLLSKKVYNTLECNGMARIDFFIDLQDNIVVSEVNTIPGFTNTSMFPLLFQEVGISYNNLLLNLIKYGFESNEIKKKKEYSI